MNNSIKSNVLAWTKLHFKGFSFREHQLEYICQIIERVLDNKAIKNQIIEAPTGSGKSIICIVSAGVLSDIYKRKSYILVSDLYLWQQYKDFIDKNNLLFGYLKGTTGNYICSKNKEDLRNGECRMAKIKYMDLFSKKQANALGFSCAENCEYIQARKKATFSSVTLMTYQLYHYQLNIVKTKTFETRDVIFCDECHNIPDIIQSLCTPCIRKYDFDQYMKIYDWAYMRSFDLFSRDDFYILTKYPKRSDFEKKLAGHFENMMKENEPAVDWNLISNYITEDTLPIAEVCHMIEDEIENKYKLDDIKTTDMSIYKSASYVLDQLRSLNDFYYATKELNKIEENKYFFVKNITETEYGKNITWSCVKEDYMTWKYLLQHAKNRVMLSATVGLKDAFDDNIGIKYSEQKESTLEKIPSTFDFSKSPILVSEKYKMTYKEKSMSFPKLKEIVYQILNKYSDGKGMIQTGNYENAKKLYMEAPKSLKKRLLLYNNSKEKEVLIEKHRRLENSVLIGPTLNEGIDLPGDLCRFIVIFKVPYPQLGDKLVQAKMKLFPDWYRSKTSNFIIQGIGRGNRYKDDWCVTYIIDGCFVDLFRSTKSQYSDELQKRMKFYR